MKIVGLTGGIGSGKTTVAGFFEELGVPVYIADVEAKKLSNSSKIIRRKLIQILGRNAYANGALNREFVASKIFKDPVLLQKINDIIHPKVTQHFKRWLKKQSGAYCIKEAAILFENGGYKNCDFTILITASKEDRLHRVMLRDNTTKEAVLERMSHQWTDLRKRKLADFVIENTSIEATKKQVQKIHITLQGSGI